VDFQLHSVPLLSRIGADRADQVRTDVDAAAAGWADAALLRRPALIVVDEQRRLAVHRHRPQQRVNQVRRRAGDPGMEARILAQDRRQQGRPRAWQAGDEVDHHT